MMGFFFIFYIIDLYIFVAAAIARMFSPIAELVIPIEIPSKEGKEVIKIHPVSAEAKIRKF